MALEKCPKCGKLHYRTDPCVPSKSTARIQRYREKHPERHAAQMAVSHALRNGKLMKKPCEVCGEAEVQAHHEDYSKQLEVRWLCREHHLAAHLADKPPKKSRNADRHPPGYQAQKQREYRAKQAMAKKLAKSGIFMLPDKI